jgi:hypothetical protein
LKPPWVTHPEDVLRLQTLADERELTVEKVQKREDNSSEKVRWGRRALGAEARHWEICIYFTHIRMRILVYIYIHVIHIFYMIYTIAYIYIY